MTQTVHRPGTIPLTGAQYEIAAGGYQAVATELGAGLRELRYAGRPVIAGHLMTIPAHRRRPPRRRASARSLDSSRLAPLLTEHQPRTPGAT